MAQQGPGFLERLRTPPTHLAPHRFDAAVAAVKPQVMAQTMAIVVVGLSVDDLGVLVLPGWIVAAVAGILWLAVGPMLAGRALGHRLAMLPDDHAAARLATRRRAGTLLALIAGVGVVVWLALFAEGVPPWAA